MNKTSPMIYPEKLHAACWGFIVGDAMGVPFEFMNRQDLLKNPATKMEGWGSHDQPPGTWSDDTSMLLCVFENLVRGGNTDDLAQLFLKWYKEGNHSPFGTCFDIGNTTRMALDRLNSGVPVSRSGIKDQRAAGNGSLMRCLPYAFTREYTKNLYRMVVENNITHSVGLCNVACFFYTRMIRALAEGQKKKEAVKTAKSFILHGWRITDDVEAETDSHRQLFNKLFSPYFGQTKMDEIESSGYVIDTLEAATWCFLNTDSYQDAVLKAVNLGGDTDTIAALTGGLAGVFYGSREIPVEWIQKIVRREALELLINNWLFNSGEPY